MREKGSPELLTDRDQYVCPVMGCEVSFDSHKANASRDRATASRNRASRRAMVKHLGDVQGHTITELLDMGVQAWSYRESTEEAAQELCEWLAAKDLIDIKQRPAARKRDSKARGKLS